jgi:hypothetical protein
MGWEKGFEGSGNPAYPGGKYFNFAGLGKSDMAKMQKKEVKNGRLAMMAFLGCMVQAGLAPLLTNHSRQRPVFWRRRRLQPAPVPFLASNC